MKLDVINETINELEEAELSLSNIRNLAALYTVKTHMLGAQNYDGTTRELGDILPSYLTYIEKKRLYQMHEIAEDAVLRALEALCNEINEFLRTLYSGTDTEQERHILKRIETYNKK